MSLLLALLEILLIINGIITDKHLDKYEQSLLELAISGKHRSRYVWLLKQSYFTNLRRKAIAILVWYLKNGRYCGDT